MNPRPRLHGWGKIYISNLLAKQIHNLNLVAKYFTKITILSSAQPPGAKPMYVASVREALRPCYRGNDGPHGAHTLNV